MSGFWRYSLLAFFGVAGVALALCLGLSSKPHLGSPNSDSAANAPPRTANDIAKPHLAAATRVAEPVMEQVKPPIAQKEPKSDLQAGSDSDAKAPVTKRDRLTAAGTPPETQLAQDDMMEQLRKELERAAKGRGDANNPAPPVPGGNTQNPSSNRGASPSAAGAGAGGAAKRLEPKSKPRIEKVPGDGDNNLSIHIQDSDLRDVLELLSEQGGLDILPSPNVKGVVSASLNGVDIDTALDAILRSTGFVAHRDGKFIYVGTPADFKVMEQSLDKIATRVYRLNCTRASDIQALVTPLLNSGIGSISVTPAAEEGMADDSTKTKTTKKQEIIVLLMPHIMCEPDACCEGDKAAAEFYRRQAVYADQMSPQQMNQCPMMPPGQLLPNDTQRQMPNQNQPIPTQRSSTASLKLAPLGSGRPLFAPVAKNQPVQHAPTQAPAIKSVVKSDKSLRQTSATQAIDGERMPGWMIDGLMQNGGAPPAGAASQPSIALPARLMPTEARPIQPEGN